MFLLSNETRESVVSGVGIGEGKAYFGTATRIVSRYSESFVPEKSEAETTSASDRIDKFPLYELGDMSICGAR